MKKIFKKIDWFALSFYAACPIITLVWGHYMNYHTRGVVETKETLIMLTFLLILVTIGFIVSGYWKPEKKLKEIYHEN